ncbi:MAG: DUF6435 family protein [Planctomycetota bacterium]
MFSFGKKDPVAKLRQQYMAKMEEARDVQRNGDVVAAAKIVAEAEEIGRKIDDLETEKAGV